VSQLQTPLIEDRFVDAVRSALETEPDWSSGQLAVLSRTPEGDHEAAEFADSAFMSRASYDLKARDLRISLRNGQRLRIAPILVEYWDRLLVAPSKSAFFVESIMPHFNVERLGWFKRVCDRFRSRPGFPRMRG
jgi:hypothetical protein